MNVPILLARLQSVHHSLSRAGFDHAVGGAIALAVHVREPRFTAHIDLNITADVQVPERLLGCLPADLEPDPGAATRLRRDHQLRFHWRDPDTPLDLFLPVHPTFHALVVERAQPVDFLGAGIKVLTATDLMVFKTLFNRSKDWVDIETLVADGAGSGDEALAWVREIVGSQDPRAQRLARLLEHGG
ncbi:hypothetical protein [Nocardioides sp.]|uniref:hypothetical protein n=1 Tax=Nocardioides sp. TaxID=35761 RepID=UPI0035146D69